MSEYVAGKGTTALGIIGTALGGIATVMPGVLNGSAGSSNYASKEDVETARTIAEKDAEIALLKANSQTDTKLSEVYIAAAERDKEIRKEIYDAIDSVRAEIRSEHDAQTTVNAAQGVINANVNTVIATLSAQQQATANLVTQITKTAVPSSAICNFGSTCTGCGANV